VTLRLGHFRLNSTHSPDHFEGKIVRLWRLVKSSISNLDFSNFGNMYFLWLTPKQNKNNFRLIGTLSWPHERKLNLKLYMFHLKRTFCISWKHRHEAFFQGLTLHVNFLRMLGIFIAGSPGEMNYSEVFQIAFKKLMCCEQICSK